ncbi:MAG TPA: hypothetical protein VHE35_13625 [Kofleriaceae bacterium]|nr:hypothetical protein [Kofleriaceae bacterium]
MRPGALVVALVVAAAAAGGGCHKKRHAAAKVADAGAAPTVAGGAAPDGHSTPAVQPTRVPACDRYQAVLIAALACPQLADNRAALQANLDTLQRNFAAWPTLPDDQRKATMDAAASQCQGGVDGVTSAMTSAGCPR